MTERKTSEELATELAVAFLSRIESQKDMEGFAEHVCKCWQRFYNTIRMAYETLKRDYR